MDNRRYKNIVYNHLRENKAVSLKILLEEEGEDAKGSSKDLFNMDSEEDTAGDSEDSDKTVDPTEEPSESIDSSVPEDTDNEDSTDSSEESSSSDALDFQLYLQNMKDVDNLISAREPEMDETNAINSIVNTSSTHYESTNYMNKFADFLLLQEKKDSDSVVKDLEGAISKNQDMIDKIDRQKSELKAGIDINISAEVSAAIDKLVHFKEKVDIIDLIEELFIKKIRLLSRAEDIETNVSEFKESYRDEVHKNRSKIDLPGSKHYNDESVYLDKHDGYNGAAGARSQG